MFFFLVRHASQLYAAVLFIAGASRKHHGDNKEPYVFGVGLVLFRRIYTFVFYINKVVLLDSFLTSIILFFVSYLVFFKVDIHF